MWHLVLQIDQLVQNSDPFFHNKIQVKPTDVQIKALKILKANSSFLWRTWICKTQSSLSFYYFYKKQLRNHIGYYQDVQMLCKTNSIPSL